MQTDPRAEVAAPRSGNRKSETRRPKSQSSVEQAFGFRASGFFRISDCAFWFLGCAALLLLVTPSAPAEHIPTNTPAHLLPTDWPAIAGVITNHTEVLQTNLTPEPQVNAALVQSAADIASTNLTLAVHDTQPHPSRPQFLLQLELARHDRLQKNHEGAARSLLALLNSQAPEDLKRIALVELALVAQAQNEPAKAQRIYAEYIQRYPDDPSLPEILLRQGLLYRQMGSPQLALSKFYGVMSVTLRLKIDKFETYRRLVLQAQTEIADTYYQQCKYEDAADYFQRLLKADAPLLNKSTVHYKLVRCWAQLGRKDTAITCAEDFLCRNPATPEEAEVRFILATLLDEVGRTGEALEQVMRLLQVEQGLAAQSPETWKYWQQRTGKAVAQKLFQESDYLHALDIYLALLPLDPTASWQISVSYDMALVYERLRQPQKALACYAAILRQEPNLPASASPGLREMLTMAKWRQDFLNWQTKAEKESREITAALRQDDQAKTKQ